MGNQCRMWEKSPTGHRLQLARSSAAFIVHSPTHPDIPAPCLGLHPGAETVRRDMSEPEFVDIIMMDLARIAISAQGQKVNGPDFCHCGFLYLGMHVCKQMYVRR